jgi:hypothetical protein
VAGGKEEDGMKEWRIIRTHAAASGVTCAERVVQPGGHCQSQNAHRLFVPYVAVEARLSPSARPYIPYPANTRRVNRLSEISAAIGE